MTVSNTWLHTLHKLIYTSKKNIVQHHNLTWLLGCRPILSGKWSPYHRICGPKLMKQWVWHVSPQHFHVIQTGFPISTRYVSNYILWHFKVNSPLRLRQEKKKLKAHFHKSIERIPVCGMLIRISSQQVYTPGFDKKIFLPHGEFGVYRFGGLPGPRRSCNARLRYRRVVASSGLTRRAAAK